MQLTARHNFSRRPPRGFTFAELVIVVLIIGLVALLVIPATSSSMSASRLSTSANVLAADIEFCLSECIARPNDPRVVYFDVTNNKYSMVALNASTVIAHPMDQQPYTNDFTTGRNANFVGVVMTSAACGNTNLTVLTFDPYGKPLLTNDLIVALTYQGQQMNVKVNATTGEVSIYTP